MTKRTQTKFNTISLNWKQIIGHKVTSTWGRLCYESRNGEATRSDAKVFVIKKFTVMKKVVLFKNESEDYKQAFNERNYNVIFVEPLQFVYTNTESLSSKLVERDFHGMILTSPRAVEAVARCWDPAKFVTWNTKKVYTVGDASSRKITLLLGLDAIGHTSGNAHNLSKIIVRENPAESKFLFPCGNLRSETLPGTLESNNLKVDSVNVYETKENENLRNDLMSLGQSEESPCCMVFFSPSGCEYVHRQLQTFSNRLFHLPHFAIGNSTAHKIENLGIEIAGVAAKPQPECVVESVEKYFSTP